MTGLPFDPPLVTTLRDVVPVNCPSCGHSNLVPWITPEKSGYAQPQFRVQCECDDFPITREVSICGTAYPIDPF